MRLLCLIVETNEVKKYIRCVGVTILLCNLYYV